MPSGRDGHSWAQQGSKEKLQLVEVSVCLTHKQLKVTLDICLVLVFDLCYLSLGRALWAFPVLLFFANKLSLNAKVNKYINK